MKKNKLAHIFKKAAARYVTDKILAQPVPEYVRESFVDEIKVVTSMIADGLCPGRGSAYCSGSSEENDGLVMRITTNTKKEDINKLLNYWCCEAQPDNEHALMGGNDGSGAGKGYGFFSELGSGDG